MLNCSSQNNIRSPNSKLGRERRDGIEVKKTESKKKKTTFLIVAATCVIVILSMFLAQALSAQAASKAQDVTVTEQPQRDSFSAIPLLMLVLPVAALAAYVLEWTGSKKSSSAL